ncbi:MULTISPECIES: NADH-ubiquinone oxidoreductase-F iron-sulfur binding region domain-containing protein [unclassified Neisseria]|uniref:NADH-ubiquinone oxidoreductase-F iron-sulfur binding region domain-containing protein n=1 Tax=unclassified Neisseria TaxID=2623750 RepID=UPI0010720EB7|nr:hypothetical protein [Neisseria sp. 19428wB4_WF04]TFU44189.1 hypothetical protein E4T99_02270 [Neisseria sp. WF04]
MNAANTLLMHPSRSVGADLQAWIQAGGGEGLLAALADTGRIIDTLRDANLAGMGGAGFPSWRKWEAAAAAGNGGDKYIVCNGTEDDLRALQSPCRLLPGSGRCALIDGAVTVTQSSMRTFPQEYGLAAETQ